jgi:acyl-CoA thioester hydrolase
MFTSTTKYRVRYADTDQMGVVYYGNYARFYEIGRTEMIRELGMPYKELEESGVMMPVYSMDVKFRDVVRYDELITIETTVKELPATRMVFDHRIINEAGKVVNEASVVLVFLDTVTRRPTRAPARLLELMGT